MDLDDRAITPTCPEHGDEPQETYPDGEGGMLYRCRSGNHWWRIPKGSSDV